MRQLFSVLFLSFASLFFSQCEIGKISFALGDVLMFFINGKVEGKNKENEIQIVDQMTILGAEKPKNIDEIEIKIQGKDKNEREGNKDEDVNANLNVDLKAKKSIITATPSHKSSNMSESSLYSEVSTTASKNNSCINNLAYHNVDKKGVFDSDGILSLPKNDLIISFNGAQTDEGHSCGAMGIIKKQNPLVNNIGEQQKRKCNGGYFDLIRKKNKKQEDQKCTLSLIREKEGSSIFIQRHEFIENNKISQEDENIICKGVKNSRIGEKKDFHKNVNNNAGVV